MYKHLEQTQILTSISLVEGNLLCSLHNPAKKTNSDKLISNISEEWEYKIAALSLSSYWFKDTSAVKICVVTLVVHHSRFALQRNTHKWRAISFKEQMS